MQDAPDYGHPILEKISPITSNEPLVHQDTPQVSPNIHNYRLSSSHSGSLTPHVVEADEEGITNENLATESTSITTPTSHDVLPKLPKSDSNDSLSSNSIKSIRPTHTSSTISPTELQKTSDMSEQNRIMNEPLNASWLLNFLGSEEMQIAGGILFSIGVLTVCLALGGPIPAAVFTPLVFGGSAAMVAGFTTYIVGGFFSPSRAKEDKDDAQTIISQATLMSI